MHFFTAVITITEIVGDLPFDLPRCPQYDVTVGTYATFKEAAVRIKYVSDHSLEFLCGGVNNRCLSLLKVQVWTLGNDTHDGEILFDLMDGNYWLTDEDRALIAGDGVTAIDGNTSDGNHTFNELYHHRAVLFSVIVRMFPDRAWKSRRHHDGTFLDDMFIVGITTPEGEANYHYYMEHWDLFECKEIERAPEWDGIIGANIKRIANLGR